MEAEDSCHEDLEVLGNNALSIFFMISIAFAFFGLAGWLKMVPDRLDGVVLGIVKGALLSHEAHQEHDLSHRYFTYLCFVIDLELLVYIFEVTVESAEK